MEMLKKCVLTFLSVIEAMSLISEVDPDRLSDGDAVVRALGAEWDQSAFAAFVREVVQQQSPSCAGGKLNLGPVKNGIGYKDEVIV